MINGSGNHVALFSTIAWCLWQRCNLLRENQSTWPLHEVGDRAKALVMEFFEANKPATRLIVRASSVWWSRPPESFYKINFDAAPFENLGLAGIEVVIWDLNGEIFAALSQKINLPHSLMAEATAAHTAILFARELSIHKVLRLLML